MAYEILELKPSDVDFLLDHLRIEIDNGRIIKVYVNLEEVYDKPTRRQSKN